MIDDSTVSFFAEKSDVTIVVGGDNFSDIVNFPAIFKEQFYMSVIWPPFRNIFLQILA
jgi:hypothetical protein